MSLDLFEFAIYTLLPDTINACAQVPLSSTIASAPILEHFQYAGWPSPELSSSQEVMVLSCFASTDRAAEHARGQSAC